MRSTKTTRFGGREIGFVLVLALATCALSGGYSAGNADNPVERAETITVVVGESTVIKAPWPTVRVAVTDPKIANVQVLTPNQVLLQGLKVGSTDLILWSEDETQTWQRRTVVIIDTDLYRSKLMELFPDAALQVSQSREVLVIRGLLRSTDQVTQLHDYLDKMQVPYVDMTSVAGVQQVQLQVRVAEVSRAAIKALGINAFHTDDDYFGAVRVGSATGGALVPSIDIGPPEGTVAGDAVDFVFNQDVGAGNLVTILAGIPPENLELFIQALAENQYLRILANPTLVSLSGEEATFLAGGEFPIPVVQGSGAGAGAAAAITIEYREYGIRLLFRPVVLGDGTIRLSASQEVSDTTEVGAVVHQGFKIPALVTRRAQTTLELKSGQTFAMAGLISRKTDAVLSRVPGLGEVPILGALFRSVRYQESETELLMLVTASLVEPLSTATTPPLPGFLHSPPNDWEFYLEGRIEGNELPKIDPTTADWLKRLGLDQLLGPGAWDSYDQAVVPSQAQITEDATKTEDTEMNSPKAD